MIGLLFSKKLVACNTGCATYIISYQACPWEWDFHGNHPMEWHLIDGRADKVFPWDSHGTVGLLWLMCFSGLWILTGCHVNSYNYVPRWRVIKLVRVRYITQANYTCTAKAACILIPYTVLLHINILVAIPWHDMGWDGTGTNSHGMEPWTSLYIILSNTKYIW